MSHTPYPSHELPPIFRPVTSTISRVSLRQRPSRSNWSITSSTSLNMDWLGSDLGDFLYWFGEQLLDIWIEAAIRTRLVSIQVTLVRKGVIECISASQTQYVHRICDDLLELCRDCYTLKRRRKALQLLLELLRPFDAWSMVLLSSNGFSYLCYYEDDLRQDPDMHATFSEITHLVTAFQQMPAGVALVAVPPGFSFGTCLLLISKQMKTPFWPSLAWIVAGSLILTFDIDDAESFRRRP
ncbi:hypothetical protein BXZ70DRAFT_1009206 [Cristinia sonorae]|uniref:Uncharacterized protein n=1 Tax=Cristinia sonorae TaxID=1940300 RepID=A0A8K0UL90_9AGAR|nr:hypothetical protein BXZ70DRAFT_1009206 [Cristinia sonorae]